MRHTVFWFVVTDLLGENIYTTGKKKNTATLVVASKEGEVEYWETKNMTTFREHNAGQNHNVQDR